MRLLISQSMSAKGFSVTSLSDKIGINRGSLSALLNGNKPFPIKYIDMIANALGHEEGWLYEKYIDECFREGDKVSKKRIEPFLIRCAELGKTECIRKTLSRLNELGNYLPLMYEIANKLHSEGKSKESLYFYEHIVDNDHDCHSERFSIAHYRIFRANIGLDAEHDWRAAMRFEPFLNRLPTSVLLDAIVALIDLHYSLENWSEMEMYSDRLRDLTESIYEYQYQSISDVKPEEPLVYYYGYGYLIKSISYQKRGRYLEARLLIAGYSDLSWFPILEEKSNLVIGQFKLWAIANGRTLDLLLGNEDILDEYVEVIKSNPDELMAGLLTILEAANLNGFNITPALIELAGPITDLYPTTNTEKASYFNLMQNLSTYLLNNCDYGHGLNCIIRGLVLAVEINNNDFFRKSVVTFECYRRFATSDQIKAYVTVMEGGIKREDKTESNVTSSLLNFYTSAIS